MNVYMVEWIDSESDHGWGKIKDSEISTALCITIGFLVKENKDFIMMSHSWDKENDSINGTIQIPKVAIKKKRKVLCQSKIYQKRVK